MMFMDMRFRCIALLILVSSLAACQSHPGTAAAPIDLAGTRGLAEQAYAAGDWRAAEPHYRALVGAVPQDADLWFRLGNVYARLEQPDAAVAAYREAIERSAQMGKAWFNMGVVQLRQAANSFLKMKEQAAAGDPAAAQATAAYDAVMAILGQQDAAAGTVAAPAREPDVALPE